MKIEDELTLRAVAASDPTLPLQYFGQFTRWIAHAQCAAERGMAPWTIIWFSEGRHFTTEIDLDVVNEKPSGAPIYCCYWCACPLVDPP